MKAQFPLAVFEYLNSISNDNCILWPYLKGITPKSYEYDFISDEIKTCFENFIDTDGVLKYVLIDDIPKDHSYCVYLDMLYMMKGEDLPWPSPDRLPFEMPDRIKDDSKNGLVYWICNGYREAWLDHPWLVPNELVRCLHTTPKNILWITGIHIGQDQLELYEEKTGLNYMYANSMHEWVGRQIGKDHKEQGKRRWGLSKKRHHQINVSSDFYKFYDQKIIDILSKKQLEKKSICYTRKCKEHRIYTLAWMKYKNLLDDSFWSKGITTTSNKQEYNECQLANEPFFDCIKPHIKFLTEIEQKPQFEEDIDLNVNQAQTICYEHPLRSYFYISIETYYHDMVFLTEKSYKPMVLMQPFIICGPKSSIQVLKDQGFKTFDKWIDHSYDNEPDKVKRFILYLKEIERLHAINSQEWSAMLYDMLPDLIYNKELLDVGIPSKLIGTLMQKTYEFFNR